MIYTMKELNTYIDKFPKEKIVRNKQDCFYNVACSFDIETSNFYLLDDKIINNDTQAKEQYKNAVKKSVMYIWQFAFNEHVIYGRTWNDFILFSKTMYKRLLVENNIYIVVYVHNLSFEFQFIKDIFSWQNIFADDIRKPIKAINNFNFVFKCSLRLSGYSLELVAKNLHGTKKIKKLVGNLNYDLIRTPSTPLTENEIAYCVNDVLILTSYINEQIKEYGNITKIPLTQTGKIRRITRAKCFKEKNYKLLMTKLTIENNEYVLMKNAFQGGFTHCNAMYANIVLDNVKSYDFTSSYPTVMIAEKYPMSKGKAIFINDIKELERLMANYCIIFDCYIENIKPLFLYESIISYSKCRDVKNAKINNGRIVSADSLKTTLTDVDYLNIKRFYSFDKIIIGLCYIYEKDYLPKPIIETILELYEKKTVLKGVPNMENEYLHSKELLNSLYGMCVTSIVHDTFTYNNEWVHIENSLTSELEKYNNDKNRFLFYAWGVYVTAYARKNLFTGIIECQQDYIYSDTDSIKIFDNDKHKKYFDIYNIDITEKIKKCLTHYNIDVNKTSPKTIEGIKKPLGIWDYDGRYDKFKTLGAKRYMFKCDNEYYITIAGLSKKKGVEYISKMDNPFDFFNDDMYIDREYTGKLTHTYIDVPYEINVPDYKGDIDVCKELSYVHLEKTDYSLSLAKNYIDYIMGLRQLTKY